MKMLITGATGFIGGSLLRDSVIAGHARYVTVRRKPPPHCLPSGVTVHEWDFATATRVEDWLPLVRDMDVVINAVGIFRETPGQSSRVLHHHAPAALFQACARAGVKRVIQISALGADAEAETAYHRDKRAADEVLMQRSLEWYVIRPSLVHGPGSASFALFRALAVMPLVALPEGGASRVQPIFSGDLIRAVVACAEGKVPAKQVIDAVGPRSVSLREWLAQLRHWQGLGSLRVISLPWSWCHPLAYVMEKFTDAPISRDALRMLRRGNHADVAPFVATFGFTPRDPITALPPPTPAERWHARLVWLRWPLLASLALVWISAGLTSAFGYPPADSYALLDRVPLPEFLAPFLLFGAAGWDCALGLAMLAKRWRRWAGWGQIATMLAYTGLITVYLPEFWLHPFGPVVKNLPLLLATLMLLAMEERP